MSFLNGRSYLIVTLFAVMLLLSLFVVQRSTNTRQFANEVMTSESMNNKPYQVIRGYVYVDENKDGERDKGERSYQGAVIDITNNKRIPTPTTEITAIPVSATPIPTVIVDDTPMPVMTSETVVPPIVPWNRTDAYGYFKYQVPSELIPDTVNYTLTLRVPPGFIATTKNPVTIVGLGKNSRRVVEFGIARNAVAAPTLSCTPRPSCLDAYPRCLIAEPAGGW